MNYATHYSIKPTTPRTPKIHFNLDRAYHLLLSIALEIEHCQLVQFESPTITSIAAMFPLC
ncbi:hypothetical protein FAD_1637 [Ferroplasma acidiphilum]|uniref:Uncharacterized protein n=2 Tax=Ferroplasma acidiphilum TaxID=74969 RepID=A0A1V0N5U0_9ARCH|nr:hypothetical protein FAD_1637 [Ferroplasma acidiphilum]